MPVTYASPGVYVEEVDKGTKPIEAAGASIAAFVGITAEASRKAIDPATGDRVAVESVLNQATLVTSWTQYSDIFGGFVDGAYLPDAVYGYFANGGGICYVTSLRALDEAGDDVSAAEATVSTSGRGTSFRVVARTPGPSANNLTVTIKHDAPPKKEGEEGEEESEASPETFTMSVGGQTRSGLSMKKSADNYIGDADFSAVTIEDIGSHSAIPAEGSYELSGGGLQPLTVGDFVGDAGERTGLGGLEAIDEVSLVVCPDLMAGYDGSDSAQEQVKSVQEAMIGHCERMRYRFAVLDTPPGLNAEQAKEWREYVNFDSSYAAMYYPWLKVPNIGGEGGSTSKMVPPSGYMVGVYNRSDAERGVHKVPANEVVRGAIDLELQLSKGEQDVLNPIGVNCIRAFPGRGIRVWGGRTLSSDGAWRYINVRRLFNMVGASLDQGLQWVVFEPNNHALWAKVRRDITSFLRVVWRSGALFGTTPEQAFYVKCDEELNPSEIRDLGQLIIEVGLAPVKPAEFVILRLSQWAGANAEG